MDQSGSDKDIAASASLESVYLDAEKPVPPTPSSSFADDIMADGLPPAVAQEAVLKHSSPLPENTPQVRGYDFNQGLNYHELLQSFYTTGFQATHFGQAVREVNSMIEKKLEPVSKDENTINLNCYQRETSGCTIFLGYTSNMISSGIRESIRYLVQHNMIDVLVTTAGGIEEDIIKCMAPTYLGDFCLKGKDLRPNGINRYLRRPWRMGPWLKSH